MIDEAALLASVDEDSVVGLLQELIRIPSTNPPGNELEVAGLLKEHLTEHGIEADMRTYHGTRTNLIARVPGRGTGPDLVFSAHMDTGPVGEAPWTHSPFSGTLHEGKVYGRGSADMKSGIAAMVQAATVLAHSGLVLSGDLILAFSYDESHGLQGAKRMVEEDVLRGAGALLVSEPSGMDVFVAEKGALWLKCVAKGKGAHTSMPQLGKNAILEMAHFLARLESSLDLSAVQHPLLGEATWSVGTIKGGVTINLIPDRCEAELDLRLVPPTEPDKVIGQVKELGEGRIEVQKLDWMEPVETDPQEDIVRISLGAVKEVTGAPCQPKGVSYFSDGCVLANRLNIPMVIIGPADATMTHQPDEHVEVSRLVQALKTYVLIAARYLA